MDVREKLMQLIAETIELYPSEREELADGLIANGVTVQEWIPVKDRLPEPGKQVLIYSRYDFCESAFYIGVPGKWRVTWNHEMLDADSVTHWLPLPQPSKGE